jgi:Ca-activated chloride channel family protein
MPTRPSMAKPFDDPERSSDSTTFGRCRLNGTPGRVIATGLLSFVLVSGPWAAPQFTSGVNVVEVYAAVVDRNGSPVTGLTHDDFIVLEDGQPQTVSTFIEGEFPLSVAIALDRSFSMTSRLNDERTAARTFLEGLRPVDEAMIVAIGSDVEIASPLGIDRRAQLDAIDRLQPWGTTGLHDAIIQSIDAIQTAKGRRALLLTSDGNDRFSNASAAEALERARRSDVMVYPITLGKTRPALFAELATLTGGRSFQPKDMKQLDETVRTIAGELRHQYLLGYTPSRPIVPGEEQWRSITVRVSRQEAVVRARDGYLSR